MKRLLQEPYPFIHQGKDLLKFTVLIFLIGFLFEYLLIPFERTSEEHKFDYWFISLVHVGVAGIWYFIYFYVLDKLTNTEDWRIWKEGTAIVFFILLIGITNWLIRDLIYNNPYNWGTHLLLEEIWHAYLAGPVIMFLVISVGLRLNAYRNVRSAQSVKIRPEQSLTEQSIAIKTQVSADDFTLRLDDLICLKANGNYTEFYTRGTDNTNKSLKRITLSNVLEQLPKEKGLIKTHRAFAVNKNKITTVTGNAGGYFLDVSGVDFKVPVSRANLDSFNRAMA